VTPGPALEPYVDDALDEIEFVNGDASTHWGAIRAKYGHPAPFPLTYVEIGNEDQFDRSGSYEGRFAQFFQAIKAKYPRLQVIATVPVKRTRPDLIDDHYYKSAKEMFSMVKQYDNADRNGPKIFVGEWATREGSPTSDLGAALGDAAWMTGLERNSDLIVMSCYAPLFVNVNPGGMQWRSDLIGYDTLSSYGSPSYYAQSLFAQYLGTEVPVSSLAGGGDKFFYSATNDPAKGTLDLKLVNASSVPQEVQIKITGAEKIGESVLITLKGNSPAETNSIASPVRIVPVKDTFQVASPGFRHFVPPYAIQVLELKVE
jgi:alpha-N-arabinofuranosidase